MPGIVFARSFAIVLVTTFVSLASAGEFKDAKKKYESGDYQNAALLLAEQLREKPTHKEAAGLLLTVLDVLRGQHSSAVEEAQFAQDWDALVSAHRAVMEISKELRTLPPIMQPKTKPPKPISWPTVDVAAELRDALSLAAESRYSKGVTLMEGGEGAAAAAEFSAALGYLPNYKDSQTLAAEAHYRRGSVLRQDGDSRGAAVEFRSAQKFVKSYKDSAELYDESRAAAVQRIAVMPFENRSGRDHLGAIGEMLSDQVVAKVLGANPEFIEFVNRTEIDALLAEKGQQQFGVIDAGTAVEAGALANVHVFVFGKILLVNESFPADQVIGPETNSVQHKNYDTGQVSTLTVRFWKNVRQGSVEVTASLSIVNGRTGALIAAEQMQETRADEARWVTFQGDQRALPSSLSRTETPGGQRPIKNSQTLVTEALEALSSKLAKRLLDAFQ